jgi:histidinol-phosphatase
MQPIAWLSFLGEVADRCDEIAYEYFRSSRLRVETKADASPVTEADQAIEAEVRAIVHHRYADLGILGEEAGEEKRGSSARLIVDPIDGTWNFLRGIPIFASLLAIEDGGEIVAAVVSAPALDTRWTAARGLGAYRDNQRIRVSEVDSIEEAQVFFSELYRGVEENGQPPVLDLIAHARRSRGFGDFFQHALVAEGAGEIAVDPIVKPWDVAPFYVLLEEAGGRATSLTGERSIEAGSLLCTNGRLHEHARAALASRPRG